MLIEELKKAPAILRLTYLADVEDQALVERRMDVMRATIEETWEALDCCYRLTIEPEVFWRLGAPVARPEVRRLRLGPDGHPLPAAGASPRPPEPA